MNLVPPPSKIDVGSSTPSYAKRDEEYKRPTPQGIAGAFGQDTLYIPPVEKTPKSFSESFGSVKGSFSNAWNSFVSFMTEGLNKVKSFLGWKQEDIQKELRKSLRKSQSLNQAQQQELQREIEANLAKLEEYLKRDFEEVYHLTMSIARQVKKSEGLLEEEHIQELQKVIRESVDRSYELGLKKETEMEKQSFWKDVTKATSIFGVCINIVLGTAAVAAIANPVGAAVLGVGIAVSAGLQIQSLLGSPLDKVIAGMFTKDDKKKAGYETKVAMATNLMTTALTLITSFATGNAANLFTASLSTANGVTSGVSSARQTQLNRHLDKTAVELEGEAAKRKLLQTKLSKDDLDALASANKTLLDLVNQESDAQDKKREATAELFR